MMISPHTNRYVYSITPNPVFWCRICKLNLKNASMAVQHMKGRSHQYKIYLVNPNSKPVIPNFNHVNLNSNNGPDKSIQMALTSATYLLEASTSEDVTPIHVSTYAESLWNVQSVQTGRENTFEKKCDPCNLAFDSTMPALQHFQGKAHTAAVQSYLDPRNTNYNVPNQSNARMAKIAPATCNVGSIPSSVLIPLIGPSTPPVTYTNMLKCTYTNNIQNRPSVRVQPYNTTISQPMSLHSRSIATSKGPDSHALKSILRKPNPVSRSHAMYPVQSQPIQTNVDLNLTCEVCDVEFNLLAVALRHYKGKEHAEKILLQQEQEQSLPNQNHFLPLGGDEKSNISGAQGLHKKSKKEKCGLDVNQSKCDDCGVEFNCDVSAKQHYLGKKHAKTVAAKQLAKENDIMCRWQGREKTGNPILSISSFGRGRGKSRESGPRSYHNTVQYRNAVLGRKEITSGDLLRKAVTPNKLRNLLNLSQNNKQYSSSMPKNFQSISPNKSKELNIGVTQPQSKYQFDHAGYPILPTTMYNNRNEQTLKDYSSDRTLRNAMEANRCFQ